MENDKIKFLRSLQLFSALTEEDLEYIRGKLIVKKFKKNEVILYEEDTNEYMYLIISGKVKVTRSTEEGKEIILAVHQTGDFFGEMSLIDGKTVPATVVSMENSQIMIISKNNFFSMLFKNKKMLEMLLQILCFRLRESWDKINVLNFNHASQRIKMQFFLLADRYGKKMKEGTTLDIKLTHQDIANMTGISRETVTRVIDKFQKDGYVSVLKGKYIHLKHNFFAE